MKKFLVLFLIVTFISSSLYCIAYGESAITITEKDNGGCVMVNQGDEFKLILASNSSTGYKWNFSKKPDEKISTNTNYEFVPANSEIKAGNGGLDIWTYKAVESGTTEIYMFYSRSWEDEAPAKTFKVKVIVKPKYQHTITSDKPMYFIDPSIGMTDVKNGYSAIGWNDNAKEASFYAKYTVIANGLESIYEVKLVKSIRYVSTDGGTIIGTFNIIKDGKIIEQNIDGALYELAPGGDPYYKFYSSDFKWHLSGYITSES
jgi:inhibitor of cysteine peptidase